MSEHLNMELDCIIRELSRRGFAGCGWEFQQGDKVYVFTVLYHWIGVVDEVSGDTITIKKARLVYNTPEKIGEFVSAGVADTIHTSALNPERRVVLQRAAIVNSMAWEGDL